MEEAGIRESERWREPLGSPMRHWHSCLQIVVMIELSWGTCCSTCTTSPLKELDISWGDQRMSTDPKPETRGPFRQSGSTLSFPALGSGPHASQAEQVRGHEERSLGRAWWNQVEKGQAWRLLTSMNVTSWGSGAVYASRVQAPILAIQEHKLSPQRMLEIQSQYADRGMKWFGTPARRTEAKGWSSGVAFLAQGFLDIWEPEGGGELFPSRCSMVYVRMPVLGVIALYVVYLEVNTGLQGTNVEILEEIIKHVAKHKVPWAAVGDFNLDAAELKAAHWVQRMRVHVVSTLESTCHNSSGSHTKIDYMLASQDLFLALDKASINKEVVMATHEAIDYSVKAQVDWPEVTVLAATPTLPTQKPQGPIRTRTDWDGVRSSICRAADGLSLERDGGWNTAINTARERLGLELSIDMEERCGKEAGDLNCWTKPPLMQKLKLNQVLAHPHRRKAKPSTYIQKVSGLLFNIAGGAKRLHTVLSHYADDEDLKRESMEVVEK